MDKILEDILTEWAYRVPNGMPNPKDNYHLIILSEAMGDLKLPKRFRHGLLNRLREIDFASQSAFKDYRKKHDMRPDTKVTIGGKETTAGEAEGGDVQPPEDNKTTAKYKGEVMNFLDNSSKPEHKEVKEKLEKLWSGKSLDDEEKKFLSKWVRVVEPTEGSKNPKYKFYVAREQGNFSRKAAPRAEKIPKSPSTGKDAQDFHSWMQQNGIMTQRTSTFGGKKTTANQTYVNKDGSTKLLGSEGKPSATVQRTEPGTPPSSITIGKQFIKRQNENEPGISDNDRKRRARHNRNLDEYAKSIDGGTLDFIDMDEGVTPDSPENRVIVIKSAIKGMVKQMNKLATDPIAGQPAPPIDPEAQLILNELDDFSNRDPNDNPTEWMKDYDTLMSKFSNNELLTEGWANYAEVYTAIRDMHDNGNGTQNGACVLLPESTTLETVDTIVISTSGEGNRKIVTLDGVSVKKGVGGASALTSKVEKSMFRSREGVSPDEVKETVVTMSKSHTVIYNKDLEDGSVEDHIKFQEDYRNKMESAARKVGVVEERLQKIKEESQGPKVENALKLIMKERKVAGLAVDSETEEKLKQRLQSYYLYLYLSHAAYNSNVDVQDFSNESVSSQTKGQEQARRIDIDSSNGIDRIAYPKAEFNVGFSLDGRSRNPGAGRFKNKDKK